jgi:hypothetical protein
LLRATARLSLLGWTAANLLEARPRAARVASTLGLLALVAHSALAFHERYAWSHTLAARETARQSEALFGWSSGFEIFANYAFLLVWAAELAWAWRSLPGYVARPRFLRDASRGFFLVMFGSGAIVFAEDGWRLLGAAAVLAVVVAWYRGDGTPRHV